MSKKIQSKLVSNSCLDGLVVDAVKEEEVFKKGGGEGHHTPKSQIKRILSSPVCPPAPKKKTLRKRKRSIEPQRSNRVIRKIKWPENWSQTTKGDQFIWKNREMG